MASIHQILQAAKILSNLSNPDIDELLPYHGELESAFVNLRRFLIAQTSGFVSESERESSLDDNENASDGVLEATNVSCEVSRTTNSQDPSPKDRTNMPDFVGEQPGQGEASDSQENRQQSNSLRPNGKQSKPCASMNTEAVQQSMLQQIMQRLDKLSKSIEQFICLPEESAVSTGGSWTGKDPRVVDIMLTQKNRSLTATFRANLGRCSLADDYLAWEKKTHETSRVEILAQNLEQATKRTGHIGEYLAQQGEQEEATTRKAIQNGIKYRVFETLYGETSASLPVFFVFHRFRDLNYQYLPRLAELIRNSPGFSGLAAKSEWRNQCQKTYDIDCGKNLLVVRRLSVLVLIVSVRYMGARCARAHNLGNPTTARQNKRRRVDSPPRAISGLSVGLTKRPIPATEILARSNTNGQAEHSTHCQGPDNACLDDANMRHASPVAIFASEQGNTQLNQRQFSQDGTFGWPRA